MKFRENARGCLARIVGEAVCWIAAAYPDVAERASRFLCWAIQESRDEASVATKIDAMIEYLHAFKAAMRKDMHAEEQAHTD